jgi:hypothetical protein
MKIKITGDEYEKLEPDIKMQYGKDDAGNFTITQDAFDTQRNKTNEFRTNNTGLMKDKQTLEYELQKAKKDLEKFSGVDLEAIKKKEQASLTLQQQLDSMNKRLDLSEQAEKQAKLETLQLTAKQELSKAVGSIEGLKQGSQDYIMALHGNSIAVIDGQVVKSVNGINIPIQQWIQEQDKGGAFDILKLPSKGSGATGSEIKQTNSFGGDSLESIAERTNTMR